MGNKYKILVYAYDVSGWEHALLSFCEEADNYAIEHDIFDESKDLNLYDIVILEHGVFFQKGKQGEDSIRGQIGTAPIIIDGLSRCIQTLDTPRISRAVAAGFSHHVTQRGNYQHRIFEESNDSR